MEKIASFTVDHTRLLPGLYLSRRDGSVTTFDLRCKRPNTGDLLTNVEMHSAEHMIATLLRNSVHKDAVVYFGPMGCQTGFYFLFDGSRLTAGDAIALLQQVFAAAAEWTGPMPGDSVVECGNCASLSVADGRRVCAAYAAVIAGWTVDQLSYT